MAAERRKQLRPLKQKVEKLEKSLEKHQSTLADVENTLAEPDIYTGSEKIKLKGLLEKQTELKKQINDTEEQWMMALEELESLETEI